MAQIVKAYPYLGEVIVVRAVGHLAPHNVLHPPPEVLGDGGATSLAEEPGFRLSHLLLKLLECFLLGVSVDLGDVTASSRRSLELPDPQRSSLLRWYMLPSPLIRFLGLCTMVISSLQLLSINSIDGQSI
jgi:hypothetical protein